MLRILDRYLVREIALPFALGLTVLTFILVLPPILVAGEEFISKGVEWSIVARAMATLLPQALSLTIPMAVLLGILVGFGRLSADREFVAMQACGVSLLRLLRPVLLVAALGTAATAYEIIVALPNANQAYREIVFVLLASRVESNVKPRVFYEDFPNKVIYVRDLPAAGGWKDVFLADTSRPGETTVYFARDGRIRLDEANRIVQLELRDATSYTSTLDRPDDYVANAFGTTLISLDPETVFKRPPAKGAPEMTIAELKAEIAAAKTRNDPGYGARFMLQQKFSLPLTCPILALIALALGASNRKDGKLASFAIGMGVIFVYYVLLWGARAAAMGGRFSPELAPWLPNIVMGSLALLMFGWRARSADQPIRFSVPAFWRNRSGQPAVQDGTSTPADNRVGPRNDRVMVVIRIPHVSMPAPRLLDLYVSREYVRVFPARPHRPARDLLHLNLHRPRGQVVPRRGHVGDAGPLLLFPHAAVCVLRHSNGRPGLHAGDRRRPDEEQRTARDARVWHQPLPNRRTALVVRRGRERRFVCTPGAGAVQGKPRGRSARTHHPSLAASNQCAQPALGHRAAE
jgi:lipopolysaccharide export system permease protein